MGRCHACGKAIEEEAAYARIALGDHTYLVCCPMCMTALEAGSIQRKMIPSSFSDENVAVFVEYLPALQVGGDYACIQYAGADRLYFIVADVSGHGITASLIMSRLSTEIESMVRAGERPEDIASRLNGDVRRLVGEQSMYLTLFAATMNLSSQVLEYVNCGHPTQLLWSHGKRRLVPLMSRNMPVGLFDSKDFGVPRPARVEVQAGDRLFFFTDGLLEMKVSEGSELGGPGVATLIESKQALPCEQAAHEMFQQIRVSQQRHPHDDVLSIVCEVREVGSE